MEYYVITVLMLVAVSTVILGIYLAFILDGLSYGVSTLLYNSDIVSDLLSNAQEFFSPTLTLSSKRKADDEDDNGEYSKKMKEDDYSDMDQGSSSPYEETREEELARVPILEKELKDAEGEHEKLQSLYDTAESLETARDVSHVTPEEYGKWVDKGEPTADQISSSLEQLNDRMT
jgi:hypothetical protein